MFLTRVPGFGNTTNLNRKRHCRPSTSPVVGRRSRPSLEALETRQLLSTYAVTNTGDNLGIDPQPGAGTGTLRQAIVDADASSSPADIVFNIPAMAPNDLPVPGFDPVTQDWTITLNSPLPAITDTVSIDGYTEANGGGVPYLYPANPDPVYIHSIPNTIDAKDGNNAEERVIIDGSQIPPGPTPTIGFELDASHSLLRGLIISGFSVGVSVSALDTSLNPVVGDLIQGNTIGDYFTFPVDTDTGTALQSPDNVEFVRAGNAQQGVVLNSSNTTVGGSNPQENNIICGNGAQGILVQPGASGNQILGNQIGMAGPSINGLYVQDGNGAEGVLIESTGSLSDPQGIVYASSNYVGSATGGNVISGNGGAGVQLVGVGAIRNLIQGNYIGVAPRGGYMFGTGGPGNGSDGGLIEDGSQKEIGGSSAALGNTIDSSHGAGIYITGVAADPIAGTPATGTGNVVANNMIGVTADGSQVLGNSSDGVAVYSPSNTIGPGNVISQNLRGIGIYGPGASTPGTATSILVVDNLIGTR